MLTENVTLAGLPKKWGIIGLIVLLVSAAFISVHGASYFYFNPDEALHVRVAEGTLTQVLDHSRFEANPPLGNLLRHYWIGFSEDPAYVRAESLLFYIGFILTCYLSGLLLGGEGCGLTMALLAVFSHGCIIQSYSARVYMFFLFFLSAAFYAYLRWTVSRTIFSLGAYAVCASLACLTHFSGIFFALCLGAHEAFRLAKAKQFRHLISLCIASLAIAGIAVSIYQSWRPYFLQIRYYASLLPPLSASVATWSNYTLLNPLQACAYIFSGTASGVILLCGMLVVMLLPTTLLRNGKALKDSVWLAAITLACGMALFASRVYPVTGTRHGLWALPLLFPAAALLLSELCGIISPIILPKDRMRGTAATLCLFYAAGWIMHSCDNRFADAYEYTVPASAWNSFRDYVGRLAPGTLLIGEKDDILLIADAYPYLSNDPASPLAAIMPYGQNRLLFNAHYFRLYSEAAFLDTMQSAYAQGAFAGEERLVFFITSWTRSPVLELMTCPLLQKQLMTFPPRKDTRPLTREILNHTPFTVMTLSSEIFLKDVLPARGKAHGCMDKRYDMTPFKHRIVQTDRLKTGIS